MVDFYTNPNQKDVKYSMQYVQGQLRMVSEKDGVLSVVIDGKTYTADKNDLFGLNREVGQAQKKELNWTEKWSKFYNDKMNEYSEMSDMFSNLKNKTITAMKESQVRLNNIKIQFGVKEVEEIQDAVARAEAEELQKGITVNRHSITSYGNKAYRYAMDAFCAAIDAAKFAF